MGGILLAHDPEQVLVLVFGHGRLLGAGLDLQERRSRGLPLLGGRLAHLLRQVGPGRVRRRLRAEWPPDKHPVYPARYFWNL